MGKTKMAGSVEPAINDSEPGAEPVADRVADADDSPDELLSAHLFATRGGRRRADRAASLDVVGENKISGGCHRR